MLRRFTFLLLLVCFSTLSAIGGSLTSGSVTLDTVNPVVELHTPNGGERWYFGDTQDIEWTVTDDFLITEPILLEVSYSGNQNFTTLEENYLNNGAFAWQIPEIESTDSYIQITATDIMGNSTTVYSNDSFTLGYVPPQAPASVDVDISNGVDAFLSWQPVTQTIYNTPIIPDGYIILYNETPYEDDENRYYFLGYSLSSDFTHNSVVFFRDEFFYTVKSYKNFSSRQIALLEELSSNNQNKAFTWGEVKTKLQQQGARK